MKVIKVGMNAQTRIAQACDRCVSIVFLALHSCILIINSDVEARKYDAMGSDRAAHNVRALASSARPATSSVVEPFPEDTPSRWKKEYEH